MKLLIRTGYSFDPSALLTDVGVKFNRLDDLLWVIESDDHLSGLAILQKSNKSEIVSIAGEHPVDSDGWADWSQSAAGEHEVDSKFLPSYANVPSTSTVYRYEDVWHWDASAPAASIAQLRRYDLQDITEPLLEQTGGRGAWVWKAVKLAWKYAPKLGDLRVQVAIWLTKQGWEKLKEQSIQQRAIWEQREWERRAVLQLVDERRRRLETGSPLSRRKARQYYTTLDKLIEINR